MRHWACRYYREITYHHEIIYSIWLISLLLFSVSAALWHINWSVYNKYSEGKYNENDLSDNFIGLSQYENDNIDGQRPKSFKLFSLKQYSILKETSY